MALKLGGGNAAAALLLLAQLCTSSSSGSSSTVRSGGHHDTGGRSPNIIVFTADDFYIPKQWEESAPRGVYLNGNHVTYGDYSTPKIDAFREESVVFTHSYAAAPKCAPSRFSVMTGRYPSRSEYAIQATLEENDGIFGTNVSIYNSKLAFGDDTNNIANVLKNNKLNPYYTGMVGKWHVMADELYLNSATDGTDCSELLNKPIKSTWLKCCNVVRRQGYDVVDAFYFGNIGSDAYSHNPEWMISRAQNFIEEAQRQDEPFYLYLATTLTHSPDTLETIRDFTIYNSSKGVLSEDEVPKDTYMATRDEVRDMALAQTGGAMSKFTEYHAEYIWLDEQFGALCEYLRNQPDPLEPGKTLYDTTMIFFINDHGMPGKGMVYEQGSRILHFVRYPPLFGTTQHIIDNMVVSNVDIAATIFEATGVAPPEGYVLDGTSYLEELIAAVGHMDDPDAENPREQDPASLGDHGTEEPHALEIGDIASMAGYESACCQYRFVKVLNSRSIVSAHHQYIWRLSPEVDTEATGGVLMYPHTYAQEQLYDLGIDPNCKENLVDDPDQLALANMFRVMMIDYIKDTCIAKANNKDNQECVMPTIGTPAPTHPMRDEDGGDGATDTSVKCRDDGQCAQGEVCRRGVCTAPSRDTDGSGADSGYEGRGSRSAGGSTRGGGRGGSELWAERTAGTGGVETEGSVTMKGSVALVSALLVLLALYVVAFGCRGEKKNVARASGAGRYGAIDV